MTRPVIPVSPGPDRPVTTTAEIQSLLAKVEERRNDEAFVTRLHALVEETASVLERLAEDEYRRINGNPEWWHDYA